MSSGDYYGRSNDSGYGGYRQQPYNSGDTYSGSAPPASYGETLDQNRQRFTPSSTLSQSNHERPPAGPPADWQRRSDYERPPAGPPPDWQNKSDYERPPPGPPPDWEGRHHQHHQRDGYDRPPQNPERGELTGRPEEGERGFLGAAAGAAAGGFGGHQVHHGVLGAVGGAIAGSLAEDHFKHKKQEKAEHERMEEQMRRQQQQQQQHWGGPPPMIPPHPNRGNFAGNFSASSREISLDRDFDLVARCGGMDRREHLTSINLNDCLTNEWGQLKWARGGNFGGSARNIRLVDNGRVLEAELADGSGGWRRSHIFLDEKITNENGDLRMLD